MGFLGVVGLWQDGLSAKPTEPYTNRGMHPHSKQPQTPASPGPDRRQSDSPTPIEGEVSLGAVGEVALPLFPGRIPSDTATNMCSDRGVLSAVIIVDNYA